MGWRPTGLSSTPIDHASATFAIAFAVLAFDPLAGAVFLVGLASALVVTRFLRPVAARLVAVVERVSDPVPAPLWRLGRS